MLRDTISFYETKLWKKQTKQLPMKKNDVHLCKLNILLNTQFNATEIFCTCLKDNKKTF